MIRVEHGTVAPIAGIAKQAGEAQASQESKERQSRLSLQLLTQQHQRNMLQIEAELDLEKQRRAGLWEIEKLETRSRLDFQQEEQNRIEKQQQVKSKLDAINKAVSNGYITTEQGELAKMDVQSDVRMYAYPQAPKQLTPQQQIEEQLLKQLMGEDGGVGGNIAGAGTVGGGAMGGGFQMMPNTVPTESGDETFDAFSKAAFVMDEITTAKRLSEQTKTRKTMADDKFKDFSKQIAESLNTAAGIWRTERVGGQTMTSLGVPMQNPPLIIGRNSPEQITPEQVEVAIRSATEEELTEIQAVIRSGDSNRIKALIDIMKQQGAK